MSTTRTVLAVVGRDLRLLAGSRTTALPMLALPLILFAVLPWFVGNDPSSLNLPMDDTDRRMAALPSGVQEALPTDPEAQLPVVILVYLLAPMLLVAPLLLAVIAAAGAIAGERERRTLETLLLSPVTDRQLFVAKTLGAWLPAVGITLLGSVVYQLVANAVLADLGVRPFPNGVWMLLTLWVAPALAAAALGATVVISARSRTFQDALQASALLLVPVIALVLAQATGAVTLGPGAVLATGAVLWVVAAALLRWGSRTLRRDGLTARL